MEDTTDLNAFKNDEGIVELQVITDGAFPKSITVYYINKKQEFKIDFTDNVMATTNELKEKIKQETGLPIQMQDLWIPVPPNGYILNIFGQRIRLTKRESYFKIYQDTLQGFALTEKGHIVLASPVPIKEPLNTLTIDAAINDIGRQWLVPSHHYVDLGFKNQDGKIVLISTLDVSELYRNYGFDPDNGNRLFFIASPVPLNTGHPALKKILERV